MGGLGELTFPVRESFLLSNLDKFEIVQFFNTSVDVFSSWLPIVKESDFYYTGRRYAKIFSFVK